MSFSSASARTDEGSSTIYAVGDWLFQESKHIGRVFSDWKGTDVFLKILDTIFALGEELTKNGSGTTKAFFYEGHKIWTNGRIIGGIFNIVRGVIPETIKSAGKIFRIVIGIYYREKKVDLSEKKPAPSVSGESFTVKQPATLYVSTETTKENEAEEIDNATQIDTERPIKIEGESYPKYNEILEGRAEQFVGLFREFAKFGANICYIGAFGFAAPVSMLERMRLDLGPHAHSLGRLVPLFMTGFHGFGVLHNSSDLVYQWMAYSREKARGENGRIDYPTFYRCIIGDIVGIPIKLIEATWGLNKTVSLFTKTGKGFIPPIVGLPIVLVGALLHGALVIYTTP